MPRTTSHMSNQKSRMEFNDLCVKERFPELKGGKDVYTMGEAGAESESKPILFWCACSKSGESSFRNCKNRNDGNNSRCDEKEKRRCELW